jgi:inorganic pyrophosphatase/K(+)-stimulated pyrophosphate-energized sodium pump
VGALTCGFCVAVFMANAGGSWDNAKKYIEGGAHGGKGTDAHKAGVVGDTVGDPFKDTSGPSLNILIKLMSMVSVVAAGFIVRFGMTTSGLTTGIVILLVIVAVVIAWPKLKPMFQPKDAS